MALKGTMEITEERIHYIAADSSNPGYLWVLQTGFSRYSYDGNKCEIKATPVVGSRALGVNKWLVQDIGFSYTQTYDANGMSNNSKTLRNDWRGAQVKGQPITLISKGTITTDAVSCTNVPLVGDTAYLGSAGKFTDEAGATSLYGITGQTLRSAAIKYALLPFKVGYFESIPTYEESGQTSTTYYKIRIDV